MVDIQSDRVLRYALERSVEIVSEASRRIPPELKAVAPDLDWRAIAGIGNMLQHDYHATSLKIILDVVKHDLPKLRPAIAEMLKVAGG